MCVHADYMHTRTPQRFDYSDADGYHRSDVEDCLCVKERRGRGQTGREKGRWKVSETRMEVRRIVEREGGVSDLTY